MDFRASFRASGGADRPQVIIKCGEELNQF